MKTRALFPLVAVVVGLSTIWVIWPARSDQPRRPMPAEAIAGAWVGYEDGCLYFYRLILQTNHTGSVVALYNGERASHYAVDDWRISDQVLTLKLSPRSENTEKILLTVKYVDAVKMEVTIKGTTNVWERKAVLHNESELLQSIRRCADSAANLPAKR